jgi:hypothetical protein
MRSILSTFLLFTLMVIVVAGKRHQSAPPPATPPVFPNQLYIKGVVRLPYAGIVESFEQWYNQDRIRVEYYGGMDTYIFRQDLNTTWQVNPEIDTETCFETDGQPDLNSYLPDTTGFILQGDAVQVNDQMCDSWQLSVTTLNKTSVYNLYMSRTSGLPVRYQMMGYDSLIGSHFDLYQVDYFNVTFGANIFPNAIFDHPAQNCGGFPGPGFFAMNPLDEMAQYYPGNEVDDVVSDEYAAYMEEHGKSYGSDAELRLRELRYHANKHFIASHQRRFRVGKESYTVGLNFLADHLSKEMDARRGKLKPSKGFKGNNAAGYHLRNYYDEDLPDSVDWRLQGAVNPPQDQGICGSCWSFGSTGAIEGAYFLKYGSLKVMAEQELMDCSWNFGNNACDGGEDYRAYDWILQNGGMSFKENYGPYLMQDGFCQASMKSPDVVLSSYVNVTEFDENALMDALASQGPISISIDASHPGLSFYVSGVYYDPACGSGLDDLDHSVLAVGYGTDPVGGDYWIVKNSWSTYWGDEGYIKMSRKDNNCGVASQPTYVLLQ